MGTENENLPAFIVLRDPKGYPGTGSTLWQNGWLPAVHRGTEFNAEGQPVFNLQPAQELPPGAREEDREFLAKLNERHRERYPSEAEGLARRWNGARGWCR